MTPEVTAEYVPRPNISEDTIQQLEDLTEGKFMVQEHKVSTEDRIRLLCEVFDKKKSNERTNDRGDGDGFIARSLR